MMDAMYTNDQIDKKIEDVETFVTDNYQPTSEKDSSIPTTPVAGHYPETGAIKSYVDTQVATLSSYRGKWNWCTNVGYVDGDTPPVGAVENDTVYDVVSKHLFKVINSSGNLVLSQQTDPTLYNGYYWDIDHFAWHNDDNGTLKWSGVDNTWYWDITGSATADDVTIELNALNKYQVKDGGISTNKLANASVTEAKVGTTLLDKIVNVQSDWNVTNVTSDAYILNKPTIPVVPGNATQSASGLMSNGDKTKLDGIQNGAEVNIQSNWTETDTTSDTFILNKPTLATVATTGSYNDLSNTPTVYTKTETDTLLDKKANQSTTYTKTEVNALIPDISGKANTSDVYTKTQVDTALSSKANTSDVYTTTQVDTKLSNKANTSDVYSKTDVDTALAKKVDTTSLATVATTGSYTDLSGTPTLATVATTGSYTDLSNKPTVYTESEVDELLDDKANKSDIPTVNNNTITIQKNSTTVDSFTLNQTSNKSIDITITKSDVGLDKVDNTSDLSKPISTATQTALDLKANKSDLATVATTGDYDDLIDKPSIPAAQVNSDWGATSGVSQILNKPTIVNDFETGGTNTLASGETVKTLRSLVNELISQSHDRGVVYNALNSQTNTWGITINITVVTAGTGYSAGDAVFISPSQDDKSDINAIVVINTVSSSGAVLTCTLSKQGDYSVKGRDVEVCYGGTGSGLTLSIDWIQKPSTTLNNIINPQPNDVAIVLEDELHANDTWQWQMMDYNGDGIYNWVPVTLINTSGGGSARDFYTNPLLQGELSTNAVSTEKIVDASVTSDKLTTASVSTEKIVDASVTSDKLASDAVISSKILNEAITTAKIADGAITTAKIADGAISTSKVGSVTTTTTTDNTSFAAQTLSFSSFLEKVWTKINALFANKVDKVTGKGLSTNDFTDEYVSLINQQVVKYERVSAYNSDWLNNKTCRIQLGNIYIDVDQYASSGTYKDCGGIFLSTSDGSTINIYTRVENVYGSYSFYGGVGRNYQISSTKVKITDDSARLGRDNQGVKSMTRLIDLTNNKHYTFTVDAIVLTSTTNQVDRVYMEGEKLN
jgi:hypothetical protein